nr:hypothetical protein [Tanacetum cinerariifolium]
CCQHGGVNGFGEAPARLIHSTRIGQRAAVAHAANGAGVGA